MASTSKHESLKEQTCDAITAEEITGAETPNETNIAIGPASQKRPNAFTELMSLKRPKSLSNSTPSTESMNALAKATKALKTLNPRNGLGIYLESPETNPEGRVIDYDNDFVVIKDKYPKASVHLLLIPRDPVYYTQHPLQALSTDPAFLATVRRRVDRLKRLAAVELRRKYGHLSTSDAPYQAALEKMMCSQNPPPPEERDALLPHGRNWLSEIVAGVHTVPSMNHLHIHIFSREMHSPWLKHKKHYLSFNTTFLVQLDELPLKEDSKRFHPGNWPSWDMKCWCCGRNFGNKFKALKEHLEEEFEEWEVM